MMRAEVRKAELHDICLIKDKLREEERMEIWASHNYTPEEALVHAYIGSKECWTLVAVDEDGTKTPTSMFGYVPMTEGQAIIWFLGTDKIKEIKQDFFAFCPIYINKMLEKCPVLFNWVDARYEKSVKWLKKCGAVVEEEKPWGAEGLPFHYLEFRRGK